MILLLILIILLLAAVPAWPYSREWGFVPRRFIVGRPLVIYWSFDGVGPDGEIQLAPGEGSGMRRVIDSLTAIFRLTRWERSGRMVR